MKKKSKKDLFSADLAEELSHRIGNMRQNLKLKAEATRIGGNSVGQNNMLNAMFNLLLWETGKRINEETSRSKDNTPARWLLSTIAPTLRQRHGKTFTEKQLYAISDFAAMVSDPGIALLLSQRVSWQHILLLLSLKETETMIFYARLANEQMLSVNALKHAMAKQTYEHTPAAAAMVHAELQAAQNPVASTGVTTQRNRMVTLETLDYNFCSLNDNAAWPDVFKNRYFLDLMSYS